MPLLPTITSPAQLRALPADQLPALATEIRDFLVRSCARTGGHLGPNLGAVELTIALHRVFDSPREPIIFDTGHQCYVHKILTGRQDGFERLKIAGGLSGYPSREESQHDWVENSHASTALSYADGMAKAFAVRGDSRPVIAVVGDGALTGGMCWEALNNIAVAKDRPVIIVVNDNGRSYSPTIGGLADRLASLRLRPGYENMLQGVKKSLGRTPMVGPALYDALHGMKKGIKDVLAPQGMFEDLGLKYVGAVDGHDIEALESAFRRARAFGAPVIVHCVTTKGFGYAPAQAHEEDAWHSTGAFDPDNGMLTLPAGPTWTEVVSAELVRIGSARSDVVAITAAMLYPTGLAAFAEAYPDRTFDVGIAEQHAVTAAAGMAMGGMRPVVALYSTFLSRAWDQVVYDVALHRLPVIFCLDRAGITGPDGPSHHGVYDMAMLARVPGMRVLAPSSAQELQVMLADAMTIADAGPVVIRYPRGRAPQVDEHDVGSGLQGRLVRAAPDRTSAVCIIAVGKMLANAERAADELAAGGIDVTVWDARCCAPLDPDMLRDAAGHQAVVTVEDGVRDGGIGMTIADRVGAENCAVPVAVLGLPTRFIAHAATPDEILGSLGLDHVGIVAAARALIAPI